MSPAEIEERSCLAACLDTIQNNLRDIDTRLNEHAQELKERNAHMWDARRDMDHIEKIAVRQAIEQTMRCYISPHFVTDAEKMICVLDQPRIHVPRVAEEDARRFHREMERLKKERTAHRNRLRGLLVAQGIRLGVKRDFLARLSQVKLWDGTVLPSDLKSELAREYARLRVVEAQIRELESQWHSLKKKVHSLKGIQRGSKGDSIVPEETQV